jgi:hypothetical protein
MKVFLSWSGRRSQAVAELLNEWLRCVLQAVRPWVSTKDLDRGSLWFGEINDQLKDTGVGVVCLTQENKTRPWILFEAGALAKGLSTSRVCTFLIDLEPKDVEDPLAQFNHTLPNQESVLALVKTLNNALGSSSLDDRIVGQVFETYWPQFEKKFKDCLSKTGLEVPVKPRGKDDVLGEILENTRALTNRIRRLEHRTLRDRSDDDLREIRPSLIRERIVEMLKIGAPLEMIFERFGSQVPPPVLREMIEECTRKSIATGDAG